MTTEITAAAETLAAAELAALGGVRGARATHDNLVRENKTVRASLFASQRELAEVTADLEKARAAAAAFQAEAPAMAKAREDHATLSVANERLRTEVSAAEARLDEVKAEWKRKTAVLDALQADLAALGETI